MNRPISLHEKINHRVGHTVKAYKHFVLLWGGLMSRRYQSHWVGDPFIHPADILWAWDTLTQIWNQWITRGDVPPSMTRFASVIHEDYLYVFGGYLCTGPDQDICNRLYRLDLTTRLWTEVIPTGRVPVPVADVIAWTHNDLLYFFGGSCLPPIPYGSDFDYECENGVMYPNGWANQLVLYSPADNAWKRLSVSGTPPSPRCSMAGDVSGDMAYIFGGKRGSNEVVWYKDIHWLDMKSKNWRRISTDDNAALEDTQSRISSSFTFISPNKAVIYGGISDEEEILNGGWELNTDDMSFSPLQQHRNWPLMGRYGHSACFTGLSLIFVGGYEDHNKIHTSGILSLEYSAKSLFSISLRDVLQKVPVTQWQDPYENVATLRQTLSVAYLQSFEIQPVCRYF